MKYILLLFLYISQVYAYQTVSYGKDNLEKFDLFYKKYYESIVITVHGGDWTYGSRKRIKVNIVGGFKQGVSIVNMDYKLYPKANIEMQIYNVAKVIAIVKKTFPKKKIFLLGEGSGAHLVSMVSLNSKFLRKYKRTIGNSINGVILLNNTAFDYKYMYKHINNEKKKLYSNILNNQLQKYSPINNITSNKIPKFLIFINKTDLIKMRDARRFQHKLTKLAIKSEIQTMDIKQGKGEDILYNNSDQKVLILYKIFKFIEDKDKIHNINDIVR